MMGGSLVCTRQGSSLLLDLLATETDTSVAISHFSRLLSQARSSHPRQLQINDM